MFRVLLWYNVGSRITFKLMSFPSGLLVKIEQTSFLGKRKTSNTLYVCKFSMSFTDIKDVQCTIYK